MSETAPYARRLVDRVAVVTGGASGIGRAMCERFAAEGATVAVVDLDEGAGGAVAGAIGGMFVRADVTSSDEVEALYGEVAARFGGIDVCCNNAGISPPDDDSILDTGLEAWERVQRVNLTSVYLCCKHALPHLLARGRGSIINTASFVAVMGAATSQISYTASKGGVLAMSRELGVQFARQGVRVNALCPGPVNTRLLQELFAKDPERAARRLVHIPMGRFGEAAEIAAAAAFLAFGRLVVHHSVDLPGRRRHRRGLRHALVGTAAGGRSGRDRPRTSPHRGSAVARGSATDHNGPMETVGLVEAEEPFPMEYASLHGHRIGYRRAGRGPMLLLLHGIAGSSRTWIPAMQLLQHDYTVLAPDFFGHGESAKPPGDYSLGNLAASVRDLLHLLDIERATVIGQSYGGGVALQFAYQFPELCERIVLVDAGGLGREVNWILRLATLPAAEFVMPVLFPSFARNWGDTVIKVLRQLGLRNARAEEVWNAYRSLTNPENRKAFVTTMRSVIDPGGQTRERHGPAVPGRAHADADRVGRQGHHHSRRPRLQGPRGHPQQSAAGSWRASAISHMPKNPHGSSRYSRSSCTTPNRATSHPSRCAHCCARDLVEPSGIGDGTPKPPSPWGRTGDGGGGAWG